MTTPVNPDLLAHLARLGFGPPLHTASRHSIADLVPLRRRRGLYVLHARDEHYLGRTESFPRRYREHLSRHPDVHAMSLLPLPAGDLHETEQRYIRDLERAGFTLRNTAGMSMPTTTGSDLDDLIPPADQARWRAGEGLRWQGRNQDPGVRRRQERKVQRYLTSPQAAEQLALLRRFVETCIPAPGLTELSLWSVTVFPRGGFRVNASWQEVFRTNDGHEYLLLVASSLLERQYGAGWAWTLRSLGVTVIPQMYRSPGHDHAGLLVHGAASMDRLLNLPGVVPAAREVTWRCLRRAPNPNSRSHAPQLVDWLDDFSGAAGSRQ